MNLKFELIFTYLNEYQIKPFYFQLQFAKKQSKEN
jgi:hypothetical protein